MTATMLVGEDLWQATQPPLPPELPTPKGGGPRVSDGTVLAGIIHVLKTGIPRGMLPRGAGLWQRGAALATTPRLA